MYNVLLVDDEKSVIESLSNNVPWSNLGVETIFTAKDGLQALKTVQTHRIDLIITDIRMPRMDGIELLRKVRCLYPDTHCILLTAYGEFEYAMQAMKLGVDNYLMKPIQMQELTETIETALDNIYTHRANKEELFRENIMRRWISGNISLDELSEKAVLIDINIYLPQYCVIAMKKRDAAVSFHAFGEKCISQFPPSLECSSVWDNSGNYIILVGGDHISREQLAETISEIADGFGIKNLIRVSIGELVTGSMNVPVSCQSAVGLTNTSSEFQQQTIYVYTYKQQAPYGNVPDLSGKEISPIVQRAINYISQHYSEGVSMKEFCNHLNVSASYLGYLFKKETGMYFNTYLLEFRISKAIDLLCNTGTKINDIASLTGYSTPNYFITSFKSKTGLSPLKYRETFGGKYL